MILRAFMMRAMAAALLMLAIGPAAAGKPAPAIPFKQDAAPVERAVTGAALGVLALSAAAIAAVLVIRRRLHLPAAGHAVPRMARVLETTRLGPRAMLTVVEFGGARYLIAQSEQGIACLASTPAGEHKQ
jgi:flagellar biogenesis protein FliO